MPGPGGSAWSWGVGGVCLARGGVCLVLGRGGCLPGPGGVCLVPGGCLPGPRGVSAWSRGGVCLVREGVCLVPGGCLPGPRGVSAWSPGGLASQHALRQTPSPHCGQTHTCKNITLATTSLRPVKNIQLNRNFIFARKKDVHITMHYVELIINTADKPCS